MIIQIVPLYFKIDIEVFIYFQDNHSEIDAITDRYVQVAWAREIAAGDVARVADLFTVKSRKPRFPGLLRSDLPCLWVEDGRGTHALIRIPNEREQIGRCIRAITDAAEAGKNASGIKLWVQDRLAYDVGERNPALRMLSGLLRVMIGDMGMNKKTEKIFAVISGMVFVIAILVLAIVFPIPSPFQYQVFRIVLSLAAAGFVSMTPGFLQVTISNFLRAGGALAVFAIVYFYNPASLIAS